jgi:cytochrome o ubiquinol oxidase subunit II
MVLRLKPPRWPRISMIRRTFGHARNERSDPPGEILRSTGQFRSGIIRPIARCLSIAALAGLSSCNAIVLDPQGPIGLAQRTILIDSVAIMLAIVLPTMAATLGFAWWFRASNTRAKYMPEFAHSGQLELITWSIPLLTIMLLGGVAWISSHDLDPARPLPSKDEPLTVQVVSLDWKWLFIYPDQHVATVNELVIPAGTPVRFALTSASVMNAFFIPQLGSMIYTMHGMRTQLNLSADTPGTYHGLSSHYSGDGFSDMHFNVQAVSANQFAAWVAKTQGSGPTLNPQTYGELARQSLNVSPFSYGAVDAGMFDKIVTQVLPPGPGPIAETNPGSASRGGQ